MEEINNSNLSPQPFGVIKRTGPESVIDVHLKGMGDNYAKALSKSLVHYRTLTKLNLKSSRLTEKGCFEIISGIDFTILKKLSISQNKMGVKAAKKLVNSVS